MRCFLELMVLTITFMYSDSVTQWDNPILLQNLVIHGNLLKLETADLQFGLQKVGCNYTWCRSYETLLHRCVPIDLDVQEMED
jgi:hypothetical protein